MKKLYLQTLLLAGLAMPPLLANAEEWRLGSRNEIYIRHAGEREWRRAPGSARMLADGWAIGTDRVYGGFGIYRWNGYGWERAPGAAVEIHGSWSSPWVVNDRGERYSWNGYDWSPATNYPGNVIGRSFYGAAPVHRHEERQEERHERDNDRDRDHDRDDDRDHDRDHYHGQDGQKDNDHAHDSSRDEKRTMYWHR